MSNNINLTKLREAREKKGLSLSQVAKYLCMSKSSVWLHEKIVWLFQLIPFLKFVNCIVSPPTI